MRFLFSLLLLGCVFTYTSACSCIPEYTPFCDAIDAALAGESSVVVVRVTDVADGSVGLTIETALKGTAPFGEFRFRRGNGADCGIFLTEARVGSRYLGIFTFEAGQSEYGGFQCGYRHNMFPIENGIIAYENENIQVQSGAPPYVYYDLRALLDSETCRESGQLANSLTLWPNPTTNGQLTLDTRSAGPAIHRLELFDLTGRLIERRAETLDFPHQLDLGALPGGVYLLHIVADRQRQVFRIVRT